MSSRVGRKPIEIPAGVQIRIEEGVVYVKGPKGELSHTLAEAASVEVEGQQIQVSPSEAFGEAAHAIVGTTRALLNNHVTGVTQGFSKKLQLVGVGYRAQLGKSPSGQPMLNLTLGLSHPVSYVAPEGVTLASSSVTEIEVSGIDRQKVGQAAADIRGICGGIRSPEPYKGKGIRYADEKIVLKETKKK